MVCIHVCAMAKTAAHAWLCSSMTAAGPKDCCRQKHHRKDNQKCCQRYCQKNSPSSSRVISNFSSRAIMISTCRENKQDAACQHWALTGRDKHGLISTVHDGPDHCPFPAAGCLLCMRTTCPDQHKVQGLGRLSLSCCRMPAVHAFTCMNNGTWGTACETVIARG